jgi:hypothetical protein
MAVIKDKNIGIAAIPLSFKRDNPIPLDSTAIWYNYDAMAAYAASSPVAYVGQLLTLVDAVEGISRVYVIKNTAGELELLHGTEGDYLPIAGGTMTGDLTLNDGSLAASQNYVIEQIEAAGHLAREIVTELPDVAEAKPNTIYMIKDETAVGDQYREYMLLNGAFVQIGDTSVDLTGYVKAENLVPDNLITSNAQGVLVDTGISINNLPVKGDDDNFVSDEQLEKLDNMALIKQIGAGLELDNAGTLSAAIKTIGSGLRLTEDGTLNVDQSISPTGIAGVKIVDVPVAIDQDNYAIIPLANETDLGVIKSGENVSIQSDGTLNVERVNAKALYQDEGDWLIFNGSDANGTWLDD